MSVPRSERGVGVGGKGWHGAMPRRREEEALPAQGGARAMHGWAGRWPGPPEGGGEREMWDRSPQVGVAGRRGETHCSAFLGPTRDFGFCLRIKEEATEGVYAEWSQDHICVWEEGPGCSEENRSEGSKQAPGKDSEEDAAVSLAGS